MPRETLLDDSQALFKAHQKISVGSMIYEGAQKNITLVKRSDPIFPFYESTLSEERANRQKPSQGAPPVIGNKKAGCFFEEENIHKTPQPRRHYPELALDGFVPVSVPNLFGFALEGRVNCFTAHDRCDPSKITNQDMYNYLVMSKENAQAIRLVGFDKMFNFINFGIKAAGTQEHPHSQDGALERAITITGGPIGNNERELQIYGGRWGAISGQDIFDRYNLVASKSAFWGFETSSAAVMAPFAPQYPDQLDIISKPNVGTIADLERVDMPGIASALAHSINFLCTERGVTDFNLVTHQIPLSVYAKHAYKNYRLHWHLYPRNKNLAGGVEVDGSLHVIDIFPENTAQALRDYFARKQITNILEIKDFNGGK